MYYNDPEAKSPFSPREFANRMIAGFAKVGNRQANGFLLLKKPKTTAAGIETGELTEKPGSACALGALALGFNVKPTEIFDGATWWPANTENPLRGYPCPCLGMKTAALSDIIPHLNDAHAWPVPDIAKWLEDETHQPTEKATFYFKPDRPNEDEDFDDEDDDEGPYYTEQPFTPLYP